jgi:hypothetical protein
MQRTGAKMKGYKEIEAPPTTLLGCEVVHSKAYAKGDLRIWITRNVYPHGIRWHLSISCRNRYPTWDEIRDARYDLLPDNITMAQLLPPKSEYVAIHPNCFHLHEIIQ